MHPKDNLIELLGPDGDHGQAVFVGLVGGGDAAPGKVGVGAENRIHGAL
jgi:hypothetical protein